MSDAIKKLHDYLAMSPSVVYPEDALAYLPAIEAENAKLLEERDMYRDLVDHMVHPDIPDQLAAENAKLRELLGDVSRLLFDLDVDYCACCPRDSNAHPCPVYTIVGGECLYKKDMRKLGIEVDE